MEHSKTLFYQYWGKASIEDDQFLYHLLPYHSLDVAAVATVWWEVSPAIRQRILQNSQLSENQLKAWVLFFIALHDLGKFDIRFQLKCRDVLRLLRDEDDIEALDSQLSRKYWHGEYAYSWCFEDLAGRFDWKIDDDPFADEAEGEAIWQAWKPWLQAVAGHHGKEPNDDCANPVDGLFVSDAIQSFDRAARLAFIDAMEAQFLRPADLSLNDLPPPVDIMFLAGFCSVCDWLGSSVENNQGEERFAFEHQEKPIDNYFKSRLPIAQKLLQESGLLQKTVTEGGMRNIFPQFSQPQQVQTLVDELSIEPALTLIEAPTGAGKTEAALALASKILAAGKADSIVFALPTQATADAMLERLSEVAERLFETTDVVLAHGKSRFNPTFINLKKAAEKQTPQNNKHELDASIHCSQWLSQSKKRAFLGQIGVCTVDQVLVSVLAVKHRFVRAFGVGKSVLIIDEVHAYDSYMYALLDGVLTQQKSMGGSAVLLSATLPLPLRSKLIRSWGESATVFTETDDYPLVTQVTPSGTQSYPLPESEQARLDKEPQRRVHLCTVSTPDMLPDESMMTDIVMAAESGANVVVICNLVADAQCLSERLSEITSMPVGLFHSRYRFKDRQEKQLAVMRDYGKGEQRKAGGILVATQVVEQSLDIDFDWMITQLCPMDLLFQRLGRLHRHVRARPAGYEQPQCDVLIPENQQYELHKLIYGNGDAPNARVLWRTEQLIKAKPDVEFPQAYRPMIERVYQESAWDDEPQTIQDEYQRFLDADYCSALMAKMQRDVHQVWDDDDANVSLMTRDGEMGLNVLPVQLNSNGECFLGDSRSLSDYQEWEMAEATMTHTIPVPRTWGKHLPQEQDGIIKLSMTEKEGCWQFSTSSVCFTYSQAKGMQREVFD